MHLDNNRLGAEDRPKPGMCKIKCALGHQPCALAAQHVKRFLGRGTFQLSL
jgi:hypothetical protein